jgi:hypothetical protein
MPICEERLNLQLAFAGAVLRLTERLNEQMLSVIQENCRVASIVTMDINFRKLFPGSNPGFTFSKWINDRTSNPAPINSTAAGQRLRTVMGMEHQHIGVRISQRSFERAPSSKAPPRRDACDAQKTWQIESAASNRGSRRATAGRELHGTKFARVARLLGSSTLLLYDRPATCPLYNRSFPSDLVSLLG